MRNITEIIIHCSATREGVNFNRNDIDRWHKQRGFDEIGYHYVILLDGTVEKGRNIEKQGAHCVGHNKNSIGICYIGGLDENGKGKDTRTVQQKVALYNLLVTLKHIYPKATIHGHREYANKECPCFDVKSEYGDM